MARLDDGRNDVNMDSDDFEDLFMRGDLLPDSSQESLPKAATNLSFGDTCLSGEGARATPVGLDSEMPILSHGYLDCPQSPDMDNKPSLECPATPALIVERPDVTVQASAASPRDQIESAFENVVDAMLNEKTEISITLKTRPATTNPQKTSEAVPSLNEVKYKRICFPGRTEREAWRFGTKFSSVRS